MTGKRIADAIHGTIVLTDLEVDLLQTQTFQRLRGVKQLGLANLVFPGADYSRLSHSVGVCHVTGRLVDSLRQFEDISPTDEAMYRATAMLHDLGHYPFSHAMERAVDEQHKRSLVTSSTDDEELDVSRAPLDHEQVGMLLLTLEGGEIATTLKKHGVDPAKVAAIIGHEYGAPAFANLVSSDLDADRIDYLLRTAHHTGLPYGKIDLDYLLAMVTTDDHGRICLDPRAMRTAEHLLLARYFDYQQVSFHKTVTAYERLLEDVLGLLIEEKRLDCSARHIEALARTPPEWVRFDDTYVTEKMREYAKEATDAHQRYKASALLARKGPKQIWSWERFAERESSATELRLRQQLLTGAKADIAGHLGIPVDYVWVTPKQTKLTKIGSRLPASHVEEGDSDEEAALGESVRIAEAGQPSVRLAECDNSIVHLLADRSLVGLSVYALEPEDGPPFDRAAAGAFVEQRSGGSS